jgi:hypothetical protein
MPAYGSSAVGTKEGIVVAYEVKVKADVARTPLTVFDSSPACRVPFLLYPARENTRLLSVSISTESSAHEVQHVPT